MVEPYLNLWFNFGSEFGWEPVISSGAVIARLKLEHRKYDFYKETEP
jgi:hypothetical protein